MLDDKNKSLSIKKNKQQKKNPTKKTCISVTEKNFSTNHIHAEIMAGTYWSKIKE